MRGILIAGVAVGAFACAHNVRQDAATGKDGSIKGARPLELDDGGEGIARGIVTYPGGDRVDWKSIELPAGKRGVLDLQMTYTTPRPGLHVSFDVFDQYNAPVALAAHHTHKRSRDIAIDDAHGVYYVRVFAPTRGDAGTYKLAATFKAIAPPPPEPSGIDIPDPPKLAAIPAAEQPCLTLDPKNEACATACPDDAPQTWKGCKDTCRTPDVNNPACWTSMACPTPPSTNVTACMAAPGKYWSPCNWTAPDPTNPLCAAQYRKPIDANVISIQMQGDTAVITLDVGTTSGFDATWHVHVLRGASNDFLPNGEGKLIRINKTQAIAKVKLTQDQISGNQRVRLSP